MNQGEEAARQREELGEEEGERERDEEGRGAGGRDRVLSLFVLFFGVGGGSPPR